MIGFFNVISVDPPIVRLKKGDGFVDRSYHIDVGGNSLVAGGQARRLVPEIREDEILIEPIGMEPFVVPGRAPVTRAPEPNCPCGRNFETHECYNPTCPKYF